MRGGGRLVHEKGRHSELLYYCSARKVGNGHTEHELNLVPIGLGVYYKLRNRLGVFLSPQM